MSKKVKHVSGRESRRNWIAKNSRSKSGSGFHTAKKYKRSHKQNVVEDFALV